MSKKKTQRGQFIPLPPNCSISASDRDGHHVQITPKGLYITFDFRRAWIQYAGDDAADTSYTNLEIPSDPEFLRVFAEGLHDLAKRIENKDGS